MTLLPDKNIILDKILKSYSTYYDIEMCNNEEVPLVAKCEFHVHNEKYVLSKKAQLWTTDANEYVYIFKMDNLSKDDFIKCKNYAYENGMKLIHPQSGHMYSYITTIFICDTCEKEAENLIKKCKITKNFKFSLHGWMDFHISCLNTSENKIFGNKRGDVTSRFLKEIFFKKSSIFKKINKEYV